MMKRDQLPAPTTGSLSGVARTLQATARIVVLILTGALTSAAALALSEPASATPARTLVTSGVPWFDTDGNLINAHGGGIFQHQGIYYFLGEAMSEADSVPSAYGDRTQTFIGNACYSSTDLVSWQNLGYTLAPGAGDLAATRVVERPHVLYNAAGNYFVQYMHLATTTYEDNKIGYATSPTPCGTYTYQGVLKDSAGNVVVSGDDNVFLDTDGTGYLLTGSTVRRLAPDFKSVAANVSSLACGDTCEAPAMFKSGGIYYFLHSSKSFWKSNDNSYETATSLSGPWTDRGLLAPNGSKTHDSQVTNVLTITGTSTTTYMYMGDRWCDTCFSASRYIWQPLQVNGTSVTLPSYESWSIDVNSGAWADTTSVATVDDATTGTSVDQFNYHGTWGHSITQYGSPAPYLKTSSYSNTAGDYALFSYYGTRATLRSITDSHHGRVAVSVCPGIGTNCTTSETVIDLYSPTRTGNAPVWTTPTVNSLGPWTLKVRVTGTKNPASSATYGVVDRVDVYGRSQDDSDNDPATITYTGSDWLQGSCTGCFGGSSHYANATGSSVTITFNGTQAAIYGLVDAHHGLGRLFVCDGQATNCDAGTLVNFYGPVRKGNVLLYQSPPLPPGNHTIKIVATGRTDYNASGLTYITLDRVDVRG